MLSWFTLALPFASSYSEMALVVHLAFKCGNWSVITYYQSVENKLLVF